MLTSKRIQKAKGEKNLSKSLYPQEEMVNILLVQGENLILHNWFRKA